jgi:flagellar export protein FliJ
MDRSTRLEPFARLAEQREQGAARSLRESHAELSRYRQRLDELLGFQGEYGRRFENLCKTGCSAQEIKRFHRFLGQLDQGIRELRSLIALAEQRCEQRRGDWLATRARFRALDDVITRYRSAEVDHRLRRDQREADERAQQARTRGG